MRGVFTLLSINCGNPMYLGATSNLIDEILEQTDFDIILTTNEVNFFSNKSLAAKQKLNEANLN